MKKLAILGPKGSFSYVAAKPYEKEYELVYFENFHSILMAVENGEVDHGLLPIENSVEGAINEVLDYLAFGTHLHIVEETILPVIHHLLVHPEFREENLKAIISHPQPLGQCREYLNTHWNHIPRQSTNSTTIACQMASEDFRYAAIGNMESAVLYGLTPLQEQIQDHENNATRFVLVQKEAKIPETTPSKCSLVFSTNNEPGALYNILSIFSLWDINLSRIESRPSKRQMGEYIFFIDFDGSPNDENVDFALTMVQRKTDFYRFLGCYPKYFSQNTTNL